MTLNCQMCGKTTVLTDAEVAQIKAKLLRSGVATAHTWNCSCGKFQIALRLAPERPHWNLVESAR